MYPNIARVTKVCSDEMANAKMQFRNHAITYTNFSTFTKIMAC